MPIKPEKDLEIIPTQKMVDDLRVLLKLKVSQLSSFAEAVNSEQGFGISKDVNLSQLVHRLSMTGVEFEQIYRIADFLYDRMAEKEIGFEDLFSTITDIAEEYNLPSPAPKRKALQKLFSLPFDYQKKKKVEIYRKGIVHNILAIASTHEVRAIFSDDDNNEMKLLGYVPIVNIRMIAEDDKEDKQTMIFSADETSLDKLIERLNEIKDKLEYMKKNISEKGVELL